MIKIIPYHLLQLVIIPLTVICINCTITHAQQNIISSSNKSIYLKHWQIAKDPAPKGTLQNPRDSLWRSPVSSSENDKYTVGNWLIRTEIVYKDSVSKETVWGLFPTNFITAYEIYWDGIKIAQNGIIGTDNVDEKAGKFNFNLPLPPHLVTVGKHTIILRISNYHSSSSWKWFYGGLIIGPYDDILKNLFISKYQAFFIIGILFIPFLFNLFLYIARKRRTEHLLFSLICFIVILDSATNLVPIFINTPTTIVSWQLYIYQIITVIFSILFPAFFIYMFSFPKKFIGLVIVINLITSLFFASFLNFFSVMSLIVLVESSFIALAALLTRREESIIIISGLALAWVAYHFNFAFAGLATTMVICTSFSIARQFARKETAEREAQLRSAHLENELLKKNINPHFILNTLTSIIVWLRKDPKSAIKLIEALAEEFRMILQISALKQIPIQQEIDLCKAHLKIMSYRKGADYKIATVDIVEEENVPPMIFHTLVENGLTHGYENKIQGTFTLQRKKNSNCVQYILSNDGDFIHDEPKDSSGFGIRYIKGRLEESYHDRWELTSHRFEQGWETIIEIKDK
ncbi:MAG: histidine kinase [Ignavibacteriales bacterium]|nr:histidine kinase [Ignavibacteriales bacterium]